MKIEFEESNLFSYFEPKKYDHSEISVRNSKEAFLKYLDKIEYVLKLIETREEIDVFKFVNGISSVCSFSFDNADYLNILSRIYNKKYVGFADIKTKMVIVETDRNGNFKKYGINLFIAYTEMVSNGYSLENYFSWMELEKLIDNDEIIVFEIRKNKSYNSMHRYEKYRYIPLIRVGNIFNSEYLSLDEYGIDEKLEFYNYFIYYISDSISNDMVIQKVLCDLDKLKGDLKTIEMCKLDSDDYVRKCANDCYDNFYNRGYLKRFDDLYSKCKKQVLVRKKIK